MTATSHWRMRLLRVAPLAACAAILFSPPSLRADAVHHTVVRSDAVKWGTAPPSLPPGVQAAVLLGSPAKEGPFVIRLKMPAGYTIPPHRHSKDELVTVLSGAVTIAPAEATHSGLPQPLAPESFIYLPAGMSHFARAQRESVVQINGTGPFDVVYLNPADDPRMKP